MKVYVLHNCRRMHRSHRTLAECVWPRAGWVRGDGPFACVSYCGRRPTVALHSTASSAVAAKQRIDDLGCGGQCIGAHEVIELAVAIRQPARAPKPDPKVRPKDAVHDRQRSRLRLKK